MYNPATWPFRIMLLSISIAILVPTDFGQTNEGMGATTAELIIPGHSVGAIRIGMKREDLDGQVFSWRSKPDEVYSHDRPCNYTEMHWIDIENDSTGVFAYLSADMVYQVTAVSKRFKVQDKQSSYGDTLDQVRTELPEGRLMRWTNSNSKVNGGKDVYFWVARSKGIAFGLYYQSQLKSRRVESVTVFTPKGTFQPDGCLDSTHALVSVQ
jgi:hypothetical protein